MTPEMLQSIANVTGRTYTRGQMHTVGSRERVWTESLPQIARDGITYSEPHMGAGEQKVIRLIQQLEAIPRRSLIVLEEPELTLHPDAQRGIGWYLMNLAKRKGHQILIATHSTDIFQTLPEVARILLVRGPRGKIDVVHRAKYLAAARELSNNVRLNKDLILVEDQVAETLLKEILRRFNRGALEHCKIIPVGNARDVRNLVINFGQAGVRAIGVRDADQGADEAQNMLSLPGDLSPEELLLSDANIQSAEAMIDRFGEYVNQAAMGAIDLTGAQRAKRIMALLPRKAGLAPETVVDRLCLSWIGTNEWPARELAQMITALFERQE